MKPKIQKWSPDTCQCSFYEYWDENGVRTLLTRDEAQTRLEEIYRDYPDTTINPATNPLPPAVKCVHHATLTDEEHGETVAKECHNKNKMLRVFLGYEGVDLGLAVTKDGATVLKDGCEYKWSFTGEGKDRVLQAEVTGITLSKTDKDAAVAKIDSILGEGKVTIK